MQFPDLVVFALNVLYHITGYHCIAAQLHSIHIPMCSTLRSVFAANSLKITYNEHEKTMAIDWNTARVLEIVSNMRDRRNVDHTLYGIVTNAKTRGGKKILRTTLLGVNEKTETNCNWRIVYCHAGNRVMDRKSCYQVTGLQSRLGAQTFIHLFIH